MLSLVGQYDSPFVRRVAVSLTVLELPFERQPLSVFADAGALRALNPLGRVPALLIEDGECLIDSAAAFTTFQVIEAVVATHKLSLQTTASKGINSTR